VSGRVLRDIQKKTLGELSWRGLLRKLFLEGNVTITCRCDGRPKKNVQTINNKQTH
jgi:hypothetical protein